MDFAVNQTVFIPSFGVGMIIGEVTEAGVTYFEIQCRAGTAKKPKFLPTMRHLCSFETVEQAFKLLRAPRTKTKASNPNQLYIAYRKKLAGGETLQLAELVRELYTRDAGELSSQRLELYEKALEQLTDEVVLVLQVERQGARGIVESIVERQPLPAEWAAALAARPTNETKTP